MLDEYPRNPVLTGRWGVPKRHIDANESSRTAASREAFEEAGAIGIVNKAVFLNRLIVRVRLLQVSKIATRFPGKTQWFSLEDAIRNVAQPGLSCSCSLKMPAYEIHTW